MAIEANPLKMMVDLVGIEPTTSSMPWKRAPSCATGPRAIAGSRYRESLPFNSRLAWTRRQTDSPGSTPTVDLN